MSRPTLHERLAEKIGADVARLVLPALPRIALAMKAAGANASYSATAQFGADREGNLVCTITGRERVPSEPVVFKVGLYGDQMRLFDGAASKPADGDDEE